MNTEQLFDVGDIATTVTSAQILAALRIHHDRDLFFSEVRYGTGFGEVYGEKSDWERRIDAWVLAPWPSQGLVRTSYEVKVNRSDFLREVKSPRKRRPALLVSNLYYFATPPGLVHEGELPIEAGLVEVRPEKDRPLTWVVRAPHRETIPPSWRFVASILRQALVTKPETTGGGATHA